MAIYGKYTVKDDPVLEKALSFESFVDFMNESNKQMEIMFEKTDMIQILREENASLAIPTKLNFTGNPEEVKKSVFERIKEIVKKFVDMVKKAFSDLADKIHEMYMNNNFMDDIMSKNKSIVTWDNLEKAKEKGWKGLPKSIPSIIKPADIKDSEFYRNMESESDREKMIDFDKDIAPIASSKSLEDAQNLYEKFMEKYNFMKNSEKDENTSSYQSKKRIDAMFDLDGTATYKFYFGISNDSKYEGYYYPIPLMFKNTKMFAENGQKGIKDVKNGSNISIKNMKLEKVMNSDQMKNLAKETKNDDNEIAKIQLLYCKASYQYSSVKLSTATKILKATLQILRAQHRYAILGYMQFVSAIKRFAIEKPATA